MTDGVAIGAGNLPKQLFVNTGAGEVVQDDIAIPTIQYAIVTGGTRGDFVVSDLRNGSMLFTQTDSVLRLMAPPGGGLSVVNGVLNINQ